MDKSAAKPLTSVQKYVVVSLLGLGFASLALDVFLDGYYCRSRPATAQPAEGRVVRNVVCHGTVVYLTSKEYLMLEVALPALFIAAFAVGALLYHRFRYSSASKIRNHGKHPRL